MFYDGDLCVSWRVLGAVCFLLAFFILLAYFLFNGLSGSKRCPKTSRNSHKKATSSACAVSSSSSSSTSSSAMSIDSKYTSIATETLAKNLTQTKTIGRRRGGMRKTVSEMVEPMTPKSKDGSVTTAEDIEEVGGQTVSSVSGAIGGTTSESGESASAIVDAVSESASIDPNALLSGAGGEDLDVKGSGSASASVSAAASAQVSPHDSEKHGIATPHHPETDGQSEASSISRPQISVSSRSHGSPQSSERRGTPTNATERLQQNLLGRRKQLIAADARASRSRHS